MQSKKTVHLIVKKPVNKMTGVTFNSAKIRHSCNISFNMLS